MGHPHEWNSSAIGTPGGQAWWARTHGQGPLNQTELDMNTSQGLEKLVSAGLFHGAGAGDDPLAMEKAFAGLGDDGGDSGSMDDNGIDISATGDPLWMQLGFDSKDEWRAAGKPRTGGQQDPPFQTLFAQLRNQPAWNPNPMHAPNRMYSHGQFTGFAPMGPQGTAPQIPGMLPHTASLSQGGLPPLAGPNPTAMGTQSLTSPFGGAGTGGQMQAQPYNPGTAWAGSLASPAKKPMMKMPGAPMY